MSEYTLIKTKQFRGCGFMTVCKYNNSGNMIYVGDKDSKLITAIDTQDYNVIGTFSGHNGIVWSLDISKDDKILISASGDLTIGFFDTMDGTKLYQSNERCIPKYVCAQKQSSTNTTNFVAIICEALTKKSTTYISIYDLDKIYNEDFSQPVKLLWTIQSKPNVMVWKNDNELIIGCDDGKIITRNINDLDGDNNNKEYQIHSGLIKSIVWNKTHTHILTGSIDCSAKHLDPFDEFKIIAEYKSTVPINCACWNHNDRKVFIGGGIEAMNVAKTSDNDLNIKIYRTKDQKLTNHICSHFGPIRFIDRAPNSKNFMSASQDGSVKIYFITDDDGNNNQQMKQSEQIEKIEKIEFNRFGNGCEYDYSLVDETNKILNLSWKPPKTKEVVVKKWIPGMPVPKDDNANTYKPTGSTNDLDKKLEELKKQQEAQNSTIRVTNLPYDIRVKDLGELFDLYGRIEERGGIRIKDYGDTTMAFIKYVYPEAAHKAIENMDGYPLDHYIIKVELAKPKIN